MTIFFGFACACVVVISTGFQIDDDYTATRMGVSDSAAPGKLLLHFTFDSRKNVNEFAINEVNGKAFRIVDGVLATGKKKKGLEFFGKPDQGIFLDGVSIGQPVTIALWIKRAADPRLDTSGRNRPEYIQEHGLGKGRLLSPLRGDPRENSGSLRIGPEKVEVWHARDQWNDLIAGPIPAEEWIHVAVTFDKDLWATGYLNGKRQNKTRSAFHFASNALVLCAASLEKRYGFPFAGLIDDVRIYDGLLNETEIAKIGRK